MLNMPGEKSVKAITDHLFNFMWSKKPDKIKRQIMYLVYIDGGLRVPKISTTFKALKLAWISKLLKRDEGTDESWSAIPNYYLKAYGGLHFLLGCNYDGHFLKQIELPPFYKEILLHMWELKQLYGYNQGQDCVIFNNKEILIEGKTFYDYKWHQHGVLSIQHLLNNKGKFLSYQEFLGKYDLDCNFLRYFQVLAAIPKHLLEKARQTLVDKNIFNKDNFAFALSPSLSINLLKVKSKDFYWLFVNTFVTKATGARKWEHDIQSVNN